MATFNAKKYGISVLVIAVFGVFFGLVLQAHALSTYLTVQGGTGTTSPSGILYGDNGATNHLNTVTVGTGLQFSGGTLSNTVVDTGGLWFTPTTNFGQTANSTTTQVWFRGSPISLSASSTAQFDQIVTKYATTTYASSTAESTISFWATNATTTTLTITGAGATNCNGTSALTTNSTGVVGCTAQPQGTVTSVTATAPIYSSGGATPNLTWFGLSTTTNLTQGQVLYNTTGGNGVASVATGTVSAGSSAITVTAGRAAIGGALAIDCAVASGSQAGCLSTTDWNTFNGKENVLTFSTPLIRTANNIAFVGLATTSQPASSNLLVSNGLAGVYGVATSSQTCSSGIACTAFNHIGTGGAITLATINAGVLGNPASSAAVPTSQATSTLYGPGTAGKVLMIDSAGNAGWYGTTTFSAGSNVTLTTTGNNIQISSTASGGGAYPFFPLTLNSTTTSATTSPIYAYGGGYFGSSTAKTYSNIAGLFTTNTANSGQLVVQNLASGAGASGDISVTADIGNDNSYYGNFGINNSGYAQSAFSAQNQLDTYLTASDNALFIGTASTTNKLADLRFGTGGTASSTLRFVITQPGYSFFASSTVGTTSQVMIASSTAPQLGIWDGFTSNNSWTFRSIGGNFFLATATQSSGYATSTTAALQIDTNSNVILGKALAVTSGGTGLNAFTSGSLPYASAANVLSALTLGAQGSVLISSNGFPAYAATSTLYNGIVGQSAYFSGTGLLIGTSTIFTNTNTNVGIASTTPWAQLSVANNAGFTSPAFAIGNAASTQFVVMNGVPSIGFGSSTPSSLWGISIGTSTVFQNTQFGGAYASSTASAAVYNINWQQGNTQRFVLTQNTTINFNATSSIPMDGFSYKVKLCQDGTGGRTISFVNVGQVNWPYGTTSLPTTANTGWMLGMIYDARTARYDVVASSSLPTQSCVAN